MPPKLLIIINGLGWGFAGVPSGRLLISLKWNQTPALEREGKKKKKSHSRMASLHCDGHSPSRTEWLLESEDACGPHQGWKLLSSLEDFLRGHLWVSLRGLWEKSLEEGWTDGALASGLQAFRQVLRVLG